MQSRVRVRDFLALLSRSLPDIRGKARIGKMLGPPLTDSESDLECIVQVRMKRGIRMSIDIRSRTESRVYWTGAYDDDVIDKVISLLPAGATVLDVGANVGFYAVAIGYHVAPTGGSVYAFEPLAPNYHRLIRNVEENCLQDTVCAFNYALGEVEEEVEINFERTWGASTGNGVILKGHTRPVLAPTTRCAVKRLDDVASELGITKCDLIKVDVEGYEYRFLCGATDFVAQHRPIIFGEFNRYWIGQCGASILDVADLLGPLGYRPHTMNERGEPHYIDELKAGEEDVWWLPD